MFPVTASPFPKDLTIEWKVPGRQRKLKLSCKLACRSYGQLSHGDWFVPISRRPDRLSAGYSCHFLTALLSHFLLLLSYFFPSPCVLILWLLDLHSYCGLYLAPADIYHAPNTISLALSPHFLDELAVHCNLIPASSLHTWIITWNVDRSVGLWPAVFPGARPLYDFKLRSKHNSWWHLGIKGGHWICTLSESEEKRLYRVVFLAAMSPKITICFRHHPAAFIWSFMLLNTKHKNDITVCLADHLSHYVTVLIMMLLTDFFSKTDKWLLCVF